MKAARVIMPFLFLACLNAASGESLWSPDFRGYLSGGKGLVVGDALVVQIDASSSLSYSSSSNDSKNLTIEFSGGESGNLFSFLPQVRTGGNLSTTGKDSLSLTASIPVVVTSINQDGTAQVQGSRAITVQGKNESITITGAVSPNLLDQKGTISFSRLANAKLSYTTFLASATDVLSPADLQAMLAPVAGASAPAAAAAGPGTGTAPATGTTAPATGTTTPATGTTAATATATTASSGLTIPDARKKQLLLLYLNRLIDVVFSQ